MMPTTAGLVVSAACNLVANALVCGANWRTPNGRLVYGRESRAIAVRNRV
jgi:hypothetical protein